MSLHALTCDAVWGVSRCCFKQGNWVGDNEGMIEIPITFRTIPPRIDNIGSSLPNKNLPQFKDSGNSDISPV